MGMFAPLYLSNVCTNRCVYCGFNAANVVSRVTLTPEEAEREAASIRRLGFRSVLILSGEAPHVVTEEYFKRVLEKLRPHFTSIGIEMFPMTVERYRELIGQGVDSLTVFQETYDEASYGEFHRGGRKSDYRWRLETPERGGAAGFRRIGDSVPCGVERLAGGRVFCRPPRELPLAELLEIADRDLLPASPFFGGRIAPPRRRSATVTLSS